MNFPIEMNHCRFVVDEFFCFSQRICQGSDSQYPAARDDTIALVCGAGASVKDLNLVIDGTVDFSFDELALARCRGVAIGCQYQAQRRTLIPRDRCSGRANGAVKFSPCDGRT